MADSNLMPNRQLRVDKTEAISIHNVNISSQGTTKGDAYRYINLIHNIQNIT